MYGAIIGDMVGSPYEFDQGRKVKDFGPLFIKRSVFTDDSVMTIAVAEALMDVGPEAAEEKIKSAVVKSMQKWGRKYPDAGYGGRFIGWLAEKDPKPYGSWGNGSAMRVSSVGWLYDSIERAREVAKWTAEVTHNHPEGIKGAEATASAIFLARKGRSKDEIREYIIKEFGYDLSRTCDEIRPTYHHVESCQETVPEAVTAFLEGKDFEDVIRTAVSLGGDCDTLTCIAGGIAEAVYGVPENFKTECKKRLPKNMLEVLTNFSSFIDQKQERIQHREHNIIRERNRYNIEKIGSNRYFDNRRIKPEFCHAFINNISFPQSLEETKNTYIDDRGMYDIEDILNSEDTNWTVPRWAMRGDICLFMHAKTANSTISRLKSELIRNRDDYSVEAFNELCSWLDKGKVLHKKYGGKIFAVACVLDVPEEENTENSELVHWNSRLYADMGEIWLLKEPIDISEFKRYVTVSNRGAITPVYGDEYNGLKNLILEKNQNAPEYFISSVAADVESSRINRFNWLRISYEYRHSFIYEKQFRIYYVDYFLSVLGDIKTIYSECRCIKQGVTASSRMDNVIKFFRRYLPVEVKLILSPDSIGAQVTKYCNDDVVYLDMAEKREVRGNCFYNNHVLLIDVDNIFLYDDKTGTVDLIYDLDNIRTEEDILDFREKLAEILMREYPELKENRVERKNK